MRFLAIGDSLLKGSDRRPLRIRPDCPVIPLSGAGIREVMERAQREVEERRVDVLLVHVGSNDVYPRQCPRPNDRVKKVRAGRHVAHDLCHHLSRLQAAFPLLHIVVSSVLPRLYVKGRHRRAHTAFNDEVKRWAREAGRVWTTNHAHGFASHPERYAADGTHLSHEGSLDLAHFLRHALAHVESALTH